MLQKHFEVIKHVGANGQVSLGKEFAGKQIQISKLPDGTLIIKPGRFVPDNEKWLYTKNNIEVLDKAIKWAETHKRQENFEEIKSSIEND
jgi:hypothetical protein